MAKVKRSIRIEKGLENYLDSLQRVRRINTLSNAVRTVIAEHQLLIGLNKKGNKND